MLETQRLPRYSQSQQTAHTRARARTPMALSTSTPINNPARARVKGFIRRVYYNRREPARTEYPIQLYTRRYTCVSIPTSQYAYITGTFRVSDAHRSKPRRRRAFFAYYWRAGFVKGRDGGVTINFCFVYSQPRTLLARCAKSNFQEYARDWSFSSINNAIYFVQYCRLNRLFCYGKRPSLISF